MKRIRNFLLIITCLVATLCIVPASVFATRAVSITPMRQRIILTPGEQFEGRFEVTNPQSSDENFNYGIRVGSYSVERTDGGLDDYGTVETSPSVVSNYNQMMQWITVKNPIGTLAPGETNVISFVIDVPENAPAGGQYASLLVSESREASAKEGSLGIVENMEMATVIYAEVTGETIEKGSIPENSMPSFLFNNTLQASSLVKNDGNVHTDAEYILQVWPLLSDEELCTNEEDPTKLMVLPETERHHVESCSLPAIGIFRAKQAVKIFGEQSIVEKTIIVCPIWLLFVTIFVVVMLVIYLFVRTKNRKKSNK